MLPLLLLLACESDPEADHLARPDPVAIVEAQRELPDDPAERRQQLIATATDPLALAGSYTMPTGEPEEPPMAVVMCDALAGQRDGAVQLVLADTTRPGADRAVGRLLEGRLVLHVPVADGRATVTFPSGLSQEVHWDGLRARHTSECSH